MESVVGTVRRSVRALSRAWGLSLTVILTLALGIGANSAVFSALDAVLLQPLPFPDGESLVQLTEVRDGQETNVGLTRLRDWSRLSSSFEAVTGYATFDASDSTGELPVRVRAAGVAPDFFEVWGIGPAVGQRFSEDEFLSGAPCVRIISDRYWRTRLESDPDVLNSAIRINGDLCSVVGVLPADFLFPDRDVDIFGPATIDAPWEGRTAFSSYQTAVGRLKAGTTLEQARSELSAVQAELGEQFPVTDRDVGVRVQPLKDVVVADVSSTLWLLFGGVCLVLLIACANIAALLLARAAHREHDIAIRCSLGAPRSAIVSQVLTETVVLVLVGAVIGLALAGASSKVLSALAPDFPRLDEVGIDIRLLLYAAALLIAVTLLCGLFPAIRSARVDASLSRSVRSNLGVRQNVHWALVGVQVALSVSLLLGAGLLFRSLDSLSRVDAGFEPGKVLAFRASEVFEPIDRWGPRIQGWLDEFESLPGVESSAASYLTIPGLPGEDAQEFQLAAPVGDSETWIIADRRVVSPGYFETVGIPLLSGNDCRIDVDGADTQRQVLANRRFVDRFLNGRSPLGVGISQRVSADFGGGVSNARIVGVVGDARERGMERAPGPTIYSCDVIDPNPWYLLRTGGDPVELIGSVRLKMQELSPSQSVYPIGSLADRIGLLYAEDRMRAVLLAFFAATALSLACLGIYGTLSYVISLRRREIGLRVALGASRGKIVAQFISKVLSVIGLAAIVGTVSAMLFARSMTSMLYGISPMDPRTSVAAIVAVMAVGLLAAFIPATRASRVEPMHVLRED